MRNAQEDYRELLGAFLSGPSIFWCAKVGVTILEAWRGTAWRGETGL